MYMEIARLFFLLGTLLNIMILIYIIGKSIYCFIEDIEATSATYNIVKSLRFDDEFINKFKNFDLVSEFIVVAISCLLNLFLCFIWPVYTIIVGMFYFRAKRRKEKLKDS